MLNLFVQENGIPQGPVLSKTLFLLAVNRIADGIPHVIENMLLVVDLSIIVGRTNLHGVGHKLQRARYYFEQGRNERI